MTNNGQRALAETVFEREGTAEREPSSALRLEELRRAAAVENMRRCIQETLAKTTKRNSRVLLIPNISAIISCTDIPGCIIAANDATRRQLCARVASGAT
jgi:hypothetical protein